ncbi:MAG TPA: hypothetical protein VHR46_08215 [Gaiella sp.]|nr:hypothetical protein [Gaiella sp.]
MTAVRLRPDEVEIARAEVESVREALGDGGYRDRLDDLLESLATGEVTGDDAGELDRVLTLALQTGRARALYGPGGEQAALRAFRKLPTGSELTESTGAVNEALAALRGRALDRLTVTAVGPGAFTLSLATDGPQVTVRLDRQGARVTSVEA